MQLITYMLEGKIQNKYVGEYVKNLPDGWYCFDINKGSKRTILQNNYYRYILGIIGQHIGYIPKKLHNIYQNEFLIERIENDPYFGERTIVKSTTTLNTVQMMYYIENVINHAAEHFDVIVPPPDPELYPPKYKPKI